MLNKADVVQAIRKQKEEGVNSSRYAAEIQSDTLSPRSPEVYELATKLKMAPAFVDRNFDTLSKSVTPKSSTKDLVENSPVVAKWLQDKENYRLASGDIENLTYLEKQFKHVSGKFNIGRKQLELSDIGWSAINEALGNGQVTPEQQARRKELNEEIAGTKHYGITGNVEDIPGFVAQQIPMLATTTVERLGFTAAGAGAGAVTGGAAGAIPSPVAPATVAVGAVAGARIGGQLGWRYGSAVVAGRHEASLAMLDFQDIVDETGQQISKEEALGASLLVGAVNGGLEMVGLEKYLGKLPGIKKLTRQGLKDVLKKPSTRAALSRYLTTIAKIAATEGVTEAMQEMVKVTGGLILENEYSDAESFLADLTSEENLAAYAESFEAGAKAGGGITSGLALPQLVIDTRDVRKAKEDQRAFEELGEAVKNSKTATDAPGTTEELLNEMGDSDLYVDKGEWDTYWQSKGQDPKAVAEEVLGSSESYDSGSDQLQIPIGKYASKIAPTEHNAILSGLVKLQPDGVSATEAQDIESKVDSVTPEQESAVLSMMTDKLVAAGYTKKTADVYAQQNAAFMHTMAERAGTTPDALMDKYLLDVSRETGVETDVIDNLGQVVKQDRRQDSAKRRRVSDMSSEERANALLTDDLTNIPNDRALQEDLEGYTGQVLFSDLDDFKNLNDLLTHEGADILLQQVGAIKQELAERHGVKAYRKHGDEFLALGENLEAYGKAVQEALENLEVDIELPDGRMVTHKGIGLSYGVGQDIANADRASQKQKTERKAQGLRSGVRNAERTADQPAEGIKDSGSPKKQLKDITVNLPAVDETGRELTIQETAAAALADAQQKIKQLEALKKCLES